MEFRILGPLEVVDGGRRLPISGPKQRSLLAVLCLHANEVVSSERMSEALWGARPPETAQATLQMHVSQLRKVLGPERIETRVPGYRLRLAPGELDLDRFEQLLEQGSVREALAVWRGPALADLGDERFAEGAVARLEELRLSALEQRIEDDLAHGRQATLVAELEALVREQPLRERFRAQLMLALYRCGRQAEALAQYKETRRLLVEELGIEPGRELQQLERRILNQDPALAAPEPAPEPAPPARAAPREERKVITVLFCDLVGFTARAEQLDPEDVSALLSRYHRRLRTELERHGGTVEKFVGDAVMALFGAPVAHEDDALRAVRAALAIRDWIGEQESDLEVRIGITTGEALVRLDADADAGQGMAAGDVVNTAARLQQAAPPGAVVVGEATYRATRDAIAYERLEPAEVKGKARPVGIWLAQRVAEVERPATPFVGREHDLALLKQTYARALRESSVQLVTIVGEPGIGKTRLVGELRSSVEEQPAEVLWRPGRCLAYGEGITFWALGQIVKAQAGILESDSPEHASAKLAAAVELVAEPPDRPWLEARLAPLVGPAGDETVEQSEAFAAWRTFLEGIAARQPLVLVIEDLHWADSALLAFVEHLVEWAADVPLLVLATARPELYERQADWGGGKRNSTTIALAPLTDEETARFVSDLLAQAALPDDTQAALLERAGGNPLYAEEFVRMLGDRGILTRRRESVEIAVGADIPVPEGVHAVIAARLDTLGPDRKALLQDASVIGKVFWAGALASMGGVAKESVLVGLHELVGKEFVRRARGSSIADDVEHTFWHGLVRDVAYGQIPRAARARKHVAAAEWIERISGDRVADRAEFLASHYSTAFELARASADAEQARALIDPAVQYSRLAGERALVTHAYEEALAHFERALRATDGPGADARGAALLFGLGRAEAALGEREEALASLSGAFDYYADAGDTGAAVAVASCSIPHLPGQLSGAPGLRRRALSLVGPESTQAAQLLSLYAVALGIDEGDYGAAEENFEHALSIARRRGDAALELEVLTRAVSVDAYHLQPEALEQGLRAIELACRLDDPLSEASSRYYVALSLWASGNLADAQAHAEAALALAESLRDRFWLATALWANETIYRMRGDFERAREFSERGLAVLPADPRLLGTRALLEHEVGDAEAGDGFVQRLLAAMSATERGPAFEYAFVASVLPLVAHISGEDGRLDEAARAAEAVLASPTVTPLVAIRAKTGSAWIAVLRRDASGAARWYPALQLRRGTMTPGGMFSVDHLLARLADVQGLQAEAVDHFRDAVTFCELSGCRAEYAWATFDFADWLVRRGERERAHELLGQVVKTAEELGMRPLGDRASRVRREV